MPRAAHACTMKITGTAVAVTGAATTCLDAGTYTKYRISTAARRVIDPATAPVVYVDAAPVTTGFVIDYANGIVKFTVALLVGNVVTLDYSYLPLLSIAETTDFSIACSRTILEKTSFDSAGAKSRLAGLKDASGDISHLTLGSDDLDPGAGSRKLHDVLQNGTRVVLEFAFTGAAEGEIFRAIAGFQGVDDKASVDALITEGLKWIAGGGTPTAFDPLTGALFGFDDGRTL